MPSSDRIGATVEATRAAAEARAYQEAEARAAALVWEVAEPRARLEERRQG